MIKQVNKDLNRIHRCARIHLSRRKRPESPLVRRNHQSNSLSSIYLPCTGNSLRKEKPTTIDQTLPPSVERCLFLGSFISRYRQLRIEIQGECLIVNAVCIGACQKEQRDWEKEFRAKVTDASGAFDGQIKSEKEANEWILLRRLFHVHEQRVRRLREKKTNKCLLCKKKTNQRERNEIGRWWFIRDPYQQLRLHWNHWGLHRRTRLCWSDWNYLSHYSDCSLNNHSSRFDRWSTLSDHPPSRLSQSVERILNEGTFTDRERKMDRTFHSFLVVFRLVKVESSRVAIQWIHRVRIGK